MLNTGNTAMKLREGAEKIKMADYHHVGAQNSGVLLKTADSALTTCKLTETQHAKLY